MGNAVFAYPEPVERYNPDGGDTVYEEPAYQWLAFQKFDVNAAQVPVGLMVRAPAWVSGRGRVELGTGIPPPRRKSNALVGAAPDSPSALGLALTSV